MKYPRAAIHLGARELLKTCTPEQLQALLYEWDLWRLPHQVAPDWATHDTWLQEGGRGSGKNTGVTQHIRELVCRHGVMRLNFIGRTAASVRDDMVKGEAGIIAAFPRHQKPKYISSQSVVRFHTGAEALMLTAEEPDSIQGKNAEVTWCDEFSTYGLKAEEVWNQVVLSTRVGHPRKIITTNSQPENDFLDKLVAEAIDRRIHITRSSSFDNFANLPRPYQLEVREMMKTALGRAWVLGTKFRPEGALWREEWFKYLPAAPPGGRTVVGVDPAGTEDGDETGIVVVRRVGNCGYVIEDLSGHHDSEMWPLLAVKAARRHGAQCMVIERNRGLDFLRALIRPHDRTLPLKEVTVSNKKSDRFAPIAMLYELGHKNGVGKIFHCGKMAALEKQMTNWDPRTQEAQRARRKAMSPDRIDACIHAIAELGFHLGLVGGGKFISTDN